jgi:gliding motility-associated-like protein
MTMLRLIKIAQKLLPLLVMFGFAMTQAQYMKKVVIEAPDLKVYDLPKSFTPNGDGDHDVYEIPNINNYPNSVVTVYNKWGELIFKSTPGYTHPWDGRRDGNECKAGNYYIEIELNENGYTPICGAVKLLR